MTVKGYYPSVSLGFEILIAITNMIAGTVLVLFGVVIILNEVVQILHLVLVGAAAIPGGILAIAAGVLAVTGSCKESVGSLKAAYIVSIVTLLTVGGIAGSTFITGGSLSETTRRNWFLLSDEEKKLIEIKYACCGFTSTSEKTDNCEPEQTCNDPLLADLGGKLKLQSIVAAITASIQFGAIFCGCCVWGTMRSQQERKKRKEGLSLEEEARGGYRTRGKKSKLKALDKSKSKTKTKLQK